MNGLINKFKELKSFNRRLFISLCLTALVPAIYLTVRTLLISINVDTSGIDIIGQMEWFDLINETLLAFLVVPLYSVFNKLKKKDNFPKLVFKLGIIIILIYLIFQTCVFIYANTLVAKMNPNEIDIDKVTSYLRLETIAFMIGIIYSIGNVIFIILGKDLYVYALLVANAIGLVISDFIFVPIFGTIGVAYSNILINGLLGITTIIILIITKNIKASLIRKDDIKYLGRRAKVGIFAGSQSLLDNLIYALMVVKMVNMVASQGNYWVANNFIWGYLLIPISALGEVIKHDSIEYRTIKQSNYYFIVIFTTIIWLITIPLWKIFYQYGEKLTNYQEIFEITLKLFPFYIAYSLCIIPDSIFTGLGKTYYNAINSLIINLGYYGIFYILYLTNAITFDMNMIILMFGFGMVVHLFVSYIEQYIFIRYDLKIRKNKS